MKEGDTERRVKLRGSIRGMVKQKMKNEKIGGRRKNPWRVDEKLIDPSEAVEMKEAL